MGYAQVEPFGSQIEDLRAGLAPAVLANIHREKDSEPLAPLDFYPHHKKAAEAPTPEQLAEQVKKLSGG